MSFRPTARLLAAAVTTALALGTGATMLSGRAETAAAVPSAAPPATRPVARTALFNDPWSTSTARQNVIRDAELRLVKAAKKGATVTLLTYSMADRGFVTELIRAHRRGVAVRVLVDDHSTFSQTQRLRKALGTRQSARSYVASCHLACASDVTYATSDGAGTTRPYQHAKALLVSRAGDDRWITVVPSGNWSSPSTQQQANDAIVTRNDRALYDFVVGRFDVLRHDAGKTFGQVTSGPTTLTLTPVVLPEGVAPSRKYDPYWALLKDIGCESASGQPTTIRLASYMWSRPRVYLAEQLNKLSKEGCRVTVITQPAGLQAEVKAALLADGSKVELRYVDTRKGDYVHSKYLVIDGVDADGEQLRTVWAGSPNLLLQGLYYSDELSIRTTDPGIVRAYQASFDGLLTRHSQKASN